jgi:AraC-like DNA-binding protein
VKFRPGGFASFVDRPLIQFADRRVRATELLGRRARGVAARLHELDDEDALPVFADVLRSFEPQVDPAGQRAGEIVAGIAADRDIISVAEVCTRWQIAPLALQRLFRNKIGIGPKWVIQRYRLHEVIERIHARADAGATAPPWAAWAAELGFTDQAHFARSFRAFIGASPGQYVRRLRQSGAQAARAS